MPVLRMLRRTELSEGTCAILNASECDAGAKGILPDASAS